MRREHVQQSESTSQLLYKVKSSAATSVVTRKPEECRQSKHQHDGAFYSSGPLAAKPWVSISLSSSISMDPSCLSRVCDMAD